MAADFLSHPGSGRVRAVRAPDSGRELNSLKKSLKIHPSPLHTHHAVKHLRMEARVGIGPRQADFCAKIAGFYGLFNHYCATICHYCFTLDC
jgi:hypothetical protein